MAAQSMAMFYPAIDFATWLTLFVLLLLVIWFLGTTRFAQFLTLLGLLKLMIMIGLSVFAISLISRKGQPPEYSPFRNWHHPGAFNGGAFGIAATLFFSGTVRNGLDILSLGVRESSPSSTRYRSGCHLLVWSLAALRSFNAVVAGVSVPFTDLRLIDLTSLNPINSSPVAIAMKTYGGPSFTLIFLQIGSIMTRFTAASSAIYGSSRAASELAEQKQAPNALLVRNDSGRAVSCFVIAALPALLSFIALSEYGKSVLVYAAESSGTPMVFVSLTIFVAHLKFSKELRRRRQNPVNNFHGGFISEASSWFGASFCCVVVLSQLWTGLGPTVYGDVLSVEMDASTLRSYLYIPITVTVYLGYKLCRRTLRPMG
ncbi:histidine permease [Knufia peltigerae]|uniref:Histidine permease n=1 Tax=Knufia peltigerae TaxID=1002370 RepID=A0AA39CHT3_9EURO|nr:histidine permease [Knufia peltigerae]